MLTFELLMTDTATGNQLWGTVCLAGVCTALTVSAGNYVADRFRELWNRSDTSSRSSSRFRRRFSAFVWYVVLLAVLCGVIALGMHQSRYF